LLSPLIETNQFVDANLPERPQHSFWLDPVFPNPASTSATIKYSLTLDGTTEIAVFDVLSRKVLSVDQRLQTAGRHELTIDTSGLRPGVYTVQLLSNRQTTTRLLTVVR